MPEDPLGLPKILGAPSRYVMGSGTIDDFGKFAAGYGKRALLIGGSKSLEKCESDLRISMDNFDIELAGFSRGEKFCTDEAAERLSTVGKDVNADLVVGVGGGSIMDLAKFVAFKLNSTLALVNTIASTDAPCSSQSVVYHESHEFKRYEFYPRSPDIVFIDTEIVAKAPCEFFVSGMGDASSTKFEAEAVHKSYSRNCFVQGGLPPRTALEMARLCHDLLMEYGIDAKLACEENMVTSQLETVVEANILLSGLGFESGGLAAAHAIHDGLTAVPDIDGKHGELVAIGTLTQILMESRPRKEFRKMQNFYSSVGLPVTLDGINLDEKDLDLVAEKATQPNETIHNEPFKVSQKIVKNSLKYVDKLGKRFKN